ncbi:hypothetical protein [uncultured Victivallis sp.]|uniref:hypothetical protein n=1 Tax=uncultured Victivallis sp. TaxID=354118 RepID=UPI00259641D0|nr:hypothetical protein [uncultured Victivallis sp.]
MKTQCPHCNQFYDVENRLCDSIVKCENCGQEFVVEPLKEVKRIKSVRGGSYQQSANVSAKHARINLKNLVAITVFWIILAPAWFFICRESYDGWRAGAPDMFWRGMGILAIITAIAVIFELVKGIGGEKTEKEGFIICPNPNCHYQGQGKREGSTSGILLVLLLCFGILPGILYLLFAGKPGIICPRCGMRVR